MKLLFTKEDFGDALFTEEFNEQDLMVFILRHLQEEKEKYEEKELIAEYCHCVIVFVIVIVHLVLMIS